MFKRKWLKTLGLGQVLKFFYPQRIKENLAACEWPMNLRLNFIEEFLTPSLFKVQLVCDSTAASLAGSSSQSSRNRLLNIGRLSAKCSRTTALIRLVMNQKLPNVRNITSDNSGPGHGLMAAWCWRSKLLWLWKWGYPHNLALFVEKRMINHDISWVSVYFFREKKCIKAAASTTTI